MKTVTAAMLRKAIERDNRRVQGLPVDVELKDLAGEFARQLLAKSDGELMDHYSPGDWATACSPAWTLQVS